MINFALQGTAKAIQSKSRKVGFYLAIVLLATIITLLPTNTAVTKAYVQQPPVYADNGELSGLPWAETLAKYSNQNGLVDSDFSTTDPNLSIAIVTLQTSPTPVWSEWNYKILYRTDGQKLTIDKTTSGGNTYYLINNSQYHGTIVSPYSVTAWQQANNVTSGCPNTYNYLPGDTCTKGYVSSLAQQTIGINNAIGAGNVLGIVTMKNVNYGPSYDGPRNYSSEVVSGKIKLDCSALDFGCHMANLWDGVQGTITEVGQTMMRGILFLFAPDGDRTRALFTDLDDYMHEHLGFLYFPYEFMAQIGDAFTSPSSFGTCNDSSCVKTFGTLMGSPFTINFSAISQTQPALWTFFRSMVLALTTIWLVFATRSKYLKVVHS